MLYSVVTYLNKQRAKIMKKVHLPISVNYVSHWGFWEGMREILQNAIDTKDYQVIKSELNGTITITSNGGALELSTLMMGESSKRNDSGSIGQYGEGYKLAMLVLSRAGYGVKIDNNGVNWDVSIEENPQLGCSGLCVSIDESDALETGKVSFVVSGLSENDFSILDERFINKDDQNIAAEHNDSYCFGADTPSIYVGGLFVCELPEKDNYWFSYNFEPNILTLDRDRSAVDSFYLQLRATELIANSGNSELLAEMASDSAKDISDYFEPAYSNTEQGTDLRKLALSSFVEKHGKNAYPIRSDLGHIKTTAITTKCVKSGMIPVVIKPTFYKMLPNSLTEKINIKTTSKPVSEILQVFLKENKSRMNPLARTRFKNLIESIQISGQ